MSSTHHHDSQSLDKKLKLSLLINLIFTIIEFVFGFISGSLALISDSGHNLTDSLSLVISILGNRIASRKANSKQTYGYGRATIIAALINASILLALSFYIFYQAVFRVFHPQQVSGPTMSAVALIGVVLNGLVAYILSKDQDDLNIKSTFLSMVTDALAQLGTVIAGLIIILTHQNIADPLISLLIGGMLLFGGWNIIKEVLHLLLEGVPKGIEVEGVKQAIKDHRLVKDIDDLHIWAISSTTSALSCHLVIENCDLAKSIDEVSCIKQELRDKFHIEHSTIETQLLAGPHNDERLDEGM